MTMAESAPGYSRRHDEPQCYNCGTTGHWAVGCPEPTRDTPAGLSWRNMSAYSQQPREQRSGQKRSKAIITRYTHPEGQPASHSQHSFYNTPQSYPSAASYPPASQPTPPHPQQPAHYTHQPPPSHYPPYSQSSHPPQQYAHGYQQQPAWNYQPPPPAYQTYAPGPPGYNSYQSAPPPPTHTPAHVYHPPYRSSTAPVPPPARISPSSSPPGPPHGLHRAPPLPRSMSGPGPQRTPHTGLRHAPYQPNHRSPPHNRQKSQSSTQGSPKGPSLNPLPAGQRGLHGLPPKPPAPEGDKHDKRHDNLDKQQQNHQRGNRDNRPRDKQGNRRVNNKRNRHKRRQNSQGQHLPQPAKDSRMEACEENNSLLVDSGAGLGQREVSETPTETGRSFKQEDDKRTSSTASQNGRATELWQSGGDASKKFNDDHGLGDEEKVAGVTQLPEGVPQTQDHGVTHVDSTQEMRFGEVAKLTAVSPTSQRTQLNSVLTSTGHLPKSESFPESLIDKRYRGESTANREDYEDRGEGNRRYSFPAPQIPAQLSTHARPEFEAKRKRSMDSASHGDKQSALQVSPYAARDQSAHRRDSCSASPRQKVRHRDHPTPSGSPRRESSPRRSPQRARRASVSSDGSDSSDLSDMERELLGMPTKAKRQVAKGREASVKTSKEQKEAEKTSKPKKRRFDDKGAFGRRW